jgi:subtilisin-like proprotein convertase family protein
MSGDGDNVMNKRSWIWILLCVLLLAGLWLFRPTAQRRGHSSQSAVVPARPTVTTTRAASTAPVLFSSANAATNSAPKTNAFAYRLTNTQKSLAQLMNEPHAILLENALLDTHVALNLSIPKHLQSQGDPGAYIVQAKGPINNAFRAALAAAGAQIVSYIPNNAYLVTVSAGGAGGLSSQPGVQTVAAYEPYYKISSSLLGLAVNQKNLPDNTLLTLGLFPNNAAQTVDQIKQLGGTVVATDQSPFGPIVRVQPPQNWTALAVLPGVQIVEPAHRRAVANDLARVTLGISADTVTPTNYMGLSGSNVLVEVNDTGIDQTHPDFSVFGSAKNPGTVPPSRIIADINNPNPALCLTDTNGHGTHVAGIIAGNGSKSYTLNANEPQGSVTNADFRGKAPAARLYSVAALDNTGTSDTSDYYLQTAPALTNALISNNSWTYVGDDAYDLAAASYDAAVRDALPTATGSQPVLFVFAAGNEGGGNDGGGGGDPDTITSPGTAKDVITVGALEQFRNITNVVTDADGNSNAVWQPQTDSSFQVASYSGRGNVGVGTEGDFGRFKPDVVAPGSFVVSTRSSEWDQSAYYNPTNYTYNQFVDQIVPPDGQNNYPGFYVPQDAVGVIIQILPNISSPSPFPTLPIYVSQNNFPVASNAATYDFVTYSNELSIPPDGGPGYLSQVQGLGFNYSIGNTTNISVGYDLFTTIITTNADGDYFTVLSNLNASIGPWYRYESGTSMATPAISGSLALIQDYFTNTLHATPSPALLKAMLINGSRAVGNYYFTVTNDINFQGWGLANVPNSVPPGLTNQLNTACSEWFLDQSPTNSLATGDSQSYLVSVTNTTSRSLPLRVTLAWTDPPGNPAAAIKLVNNLILMVSNNISGAVYFGNDFPASSTFNEAWNTNGSPNLDTINNIQNVFLPAADGSNYTVTVIGRNVNVNAVTAQSNNVVQDYALVISSGDTVDNITNAFVVTAPNPLVSNPTGDQQITTVLINGNGMATNSSNGGGVFLNQLAGANTPLLGTNTVEAVSNYDKTAVVTVGMTNQWHFYVVQNTTGFSNAAFVTFLPDTLSMPRMGVYVEQSQNPTTPEADIDLYVSTDRSLTNLNPVVISNCVNGTQVGMTAGGVFNGASLSGGGTEYVADTASLQGQVYYVGIKSETAIAGEFGFLPVFSQQPFSQTQNGIETVNGLLLPMDVPDGSPAHPGAAYIFALAIQPVLVQDVIVSNTIVHENFGDLIGSLAHNGKGVVLNNHDSLINPPGPYSFKYYDGPQPPQTTLALDSQPSDGPGSLSSFQGQEGTGPWMLTEVDNALTHTGAVTGLTITLTPHTPLNQGVNVSISAHGYFYGFIDVPVGTTNLTLSATNISGTSLDPNTPKYSLQVPPYGILYEKLGQQPVPPPTPLTNFDQSVTLNNFGPLGPGGSIFVTPYDVPPIEPGRYYVTLYNPAAIAQQYFIIASLGIGKVQTVNFTPAGPVPLLDDAVSYAYLTNYPGPNATNETIASIAVGIRVDHPRISDLVFTLISPDGTRYLLMQNRGGTSTNGAGATTYTTNDIANYTASGTTNSVTNFVAVSAASGILPITWNFFQIPDEMTVYNNTNGNYGPANLLFDTGMTNGTGQVNLAFNTTSGGLAIIMNQFGNTNGVNGDAWTYTAGGVTSNYYYLTFTDDTNIITPPIIPPMIPIKFAPTPFVPGYSIVTNFSIVPMVVTNFVTNNISAFATAPGDYPAGFVVNNWTVLSNQVSVVADPTTALNTSNLLALANGSISNTLPTVAGQTYTLSFAYRGPAAAAWYRAESNAVDNINGNNGTLVGSTLTYSNGEVGQAFVFDSSKTSYVSLPNPPSLSGIGANGSGVTIEAWINPPTACNGPILEWDGPDDGLQFWVQSPGELFSNIRDTAGNSHVVDTVYGLLNPSAFQHAALTYDKLSGKALIYLNGSVVASQNFGNITPQTIYPNPRIGRRQSGATTTETFIGSIDELGVYQRALSASEIKAIYALGTNGKYDPVEFTNSPQLSLSEAGVSVPGVIQTNLFGNNANWQTENITFTPAQSNTPVVIQGIEPGMLLDAVTLTQALLVTNGYVTNVFYTTTYNANTLDYLPEQDLTPLVGTSAYGVWALEIQDDRVGATNNAVLDSWQLQFVFADTNPAPFIPTLPITIPGTEICNLVPATNILWYQVNVPLNAIFATNTLISSDQPVNLLFNQNFPGIAGATILLTNQTSGISILSTNSTPLLVPGSTYYLGVQNTNGVTANTCIQVDFNLLATAYAYTEPAQLVTLSSAQLNGFATPNGFQANAWFQWGTNTAYGNQTPLVPVGAGYNVVYTTSPITNLLANVPYHFRLVVSNALGAVYGFDQILDEANVVAWGPNYAGQLNVPTNKNVTAIAGAYDHSLALTTNGQVLAWGDNIFGQTTIPAILTNLTTVAVAGGQYYSMAMVNGGTVTSWGADLLPGQTNVPPGLVNVVTIAGGTYSSLALQNNGNVVAWGASFYGLTNVPANATNIVAIAGGGYHSLALKNDGTVTAWGDNTNVPANATNVVAIAAGGYHSLALRYDGTVVAWGDDSVGQTNVPPGLSNVVAIAAGGFHNLALKSDGTLVTWGDNSAGQSSVPVGLTNVVAISAGYLHSLALTPQMLINSTNPFVVPLPPGVPITNNIFAGDVTYYQVTVPTNADFATNTLLFANYGGLNIWFSTNTPPVPNATNATELGINVTNGVWILGTNAVPPPQLVPGSTYYLGVQNPNNFTVNYAVEVNFHLTNVIPPPFTNIITISSIIKTNGGFLLTWFAPSNDLFQVQWSSNLPPVWSTFTNIVSFNTNVFTGAPLTQFNYFDDGSQAPFVGPTRFYRLVQLGSLLSLSNGVPQTENVAPGGTAYFSITVPTTADAATNTLLSASAPVNLLFNQNTLPTGANTGGYTLLNNSTGGISTLTSATTPPLVPGATYYLGVQNTNTVTVQFTLQVNFHLTAAPITNYPISTVKFTTIGGTNGILFTWFAPTNYQFQIQWATSLWPAPISWTTVPGAVPTLINITGTTGTYQWFDDFTFTGGFGSQKFYRLIAYPPGVPVPSLLVISSAKMLPGGNIQLQWAGSTNYLYDVLWSTNLALSASNWNVLSNLAPPTLTYTNGTFTFSTNAVSLTGGASGAFFRVLELP